MFRQPGFVLIREFGFWSNSFPSPALFIWKKTWLGLSENNVIMNKRDIFVIGQVKLLVLISEDIDRADG